MADAPSKPKREWSQDDDFLKFKVLKRFRDRGLPMGPLYLDRIDYEGGVICQTGYAPYFLIVSDLTDFMRQAGIRFLVRGSGCGSAYVWGLHISHRWLDPIEYGIPFERFLNPERVSMPDLDIDIQDDKRHLVVEYTVNKYGKDNVARIISFGTLGAKAAIKDVARSLQLPDYQAVADRITAAIPLGKTTLKEAIEKSELLREMETQQPELFKAARLVEGYTRHTSVHAAGVVIAPSAMTNYVPLYFDGSAESRKTPEDWEPTTQWDMYDAEDRGMLKMDFLGLKTLRVIDESVQWINYIKENALGEKPDFDIDTIDRFDEATWRLLAEGRLAGVFQVERQYVRNFAKRMNLLRRDPWDLAVLVAIIRPGMMDAGMTEVYLRRASGQEETTPLHPLLAETLKKTYGCMCFHGDTPVAMADGRHKPIREVGIGDHVCTVDWPTRRVRTSKIIESGPTRRGQGLRIKLANGSILCVTPDHKICGSHGPVEAQSLAVGDLIAVANRIPGAGVSGLPIAQWLGDDVHVAYLLGLLTGDGCLKSTGVRLAAGLKQDADRLEAWFAAHLPKLRVKKFHSTRCWYLQLSCGDLSGLRYPQNRLTKFGKLIADAGLRRGASTKRIPQCIWSAGDQVKWAYLAGLVDSDGSICVNRNGSGVCCISSTSAGLREDIRHLLAQFGIPTTVYPTKVFLWDTQQVFDRIRDRLVVRDVRGRVTDGSTCGVIPKAAFRALKPDNETVGSFCQLAGIGRGVWHRVAPVKTRTAVCAGYDPGDLRFYPIVSIAGVENEQFYNVTVDDDNHNILASLIVAKQCFQEDVMAVARDLSGFTMARADVLRKGIGKKLPEFVAKMYPEFEAGAITRGVSKADIDRIWEALSSHSRYSFNNAHAGAYGMVLTYQTAWLKARWPLVFMTCLINSESGVGNKEQGYNAKVAEYVEEARIMGLPVLPPCVKRSGPGCSIDWATQTIRFGLEMVKKAGRNAIAWIMRNCRQADCFKEFILACYEIQEVPYEAFRDKKGRDQPAGAQWKVYTRAGKQDIESLIFAGAFDVYDDDREKLLATLEPLQQLAKKYWEQEAKIRNGSTRAMKPVEVKRLIDELTVSEETLQRQGLEHRLQLERAYTGCYLSESPFAPYRKIIGEYATCSAAVVKEGQYEDGESFKGGVFAGILRDFRAITVKNGKNKGREMAYLTWTGINGDVETVCFSDAWDQTHKKPGGVERGKVYLVSVNPDRNGQSPIANDMTRLSNNGFAQAA